MINYPDGSNEYPQSMFWAEILKISEFLSKNFQFLEVKFSIYLNSHIFKMMTLLPPVPAPGPNPTSSSSLFAHLLPQSHLIVFKHYPLPAADLFYTAISYQYILILHRHTYRWTSKAWTSLGLWKFILDMGSWSHCGLIIAPGPEL